MPSKNDFSKLMDAASAKDLDVRLPAYANSKTTFLRVEVHKASGDGKTTIIDHEVVKRADTVEKAAQRILARMRKERIL